MVLYPPARPLLATLPEYPALGESIAYQLNGLIVVFIALSSIWALMELIGFFFRQARKAPAAAPKPATVSSADSLSPTPELIAVIVASVASVLDRPHRITAIAPVEMGRDWAREGRREIFASHKTR